MAAPEPANVSEKVEGIAERVAGFTPEDAASTARELGKQVQSATEMMRELALRLGRSPTIPAAGLRRQGGVLREEELPAQTERNGHEREVGAVSSEHPRVACLAKCLPLACS